MSDEREMRFAVIGAGNITSLRHIPALKASGRARILGIVDHHEDRAASVAKRFGLPRWGVDLEEGWLDEVDAVTIGVPPEAHAAVAGAALKRGKHVLLEKPMAMTVAEGEELVAAATEHGRVLAVVHNFQFARSAERLQSLLGGGYLGDVRGFLCFQTSTSERRLPVWHDDLPLGLFYDELPHLLYLLRAFGKNLQVQSVTVSPSRNGRKTPAVVTAHLLASNVPAVLYNNFEAPVSEWQFVVFGSRRAAAIDVFRDILVTLPHDGQHLAGDVLRTSVLATTGHFWGVLRSGIALLRGRLLYGNIEVVRRFIRAIETGEPPAGIGARDGLEVLRLQHEILAAAASVSAATARAPV